MAALMAPPPGAVAAETAVEMGLSPRTARDRRDRLVAEIRKELLPGETAVFFLLGAPPSDLEEFRQGSSFYYLTGLDAAGAGLILSVTPDASDERLFLPRRNHAAEKWSGAALGPGTVDDVTHQPDAERVRALAVTGFRGRKEGDPSGVEESASMRTALSSFLSRSGALFLDYAPPALDEPDTVESKLVSEVRARYPQVRIVSARPLLTRLRLVKTAEEIESIRKGASITCDAHRAAMHLLKPGMMEYEIEAALEYVFTQSGARYSSYPGIVGSGPNSCVLHYFRNARKIEAGDLVLIDAAAEYARYASDFTRTLPASGRFTADQRRVYDAVRKAQSEAAELVRPGSKIRDVHERARKVLDEAGLGDRFLHGCCHFVGLDVHDVGDSDTVLVPGMVLTVEPGAYISEKELGVRIEDLFLVTETGHENLTACLTSDPDEIEKEMARHVDAPTFAPIGRP